MPDVDKVLKIGFSSFLIDNTWTIVKTRPFEWSDRAEWPVLSGCNVKTTRLSHKATQCSRTPLNMPKRKRGQEKPRQAEARESEVVDHSVLGGLKGGYRVTGDDDSITEDGAVQPFKIPFKERAIVCERRGDKDEPDLIFTHGAGGGLANPATKEFAEGFAEVSSIVCFQGTMNLQSRIQTFHAVIEHKKVDCALGGRSMGARAAVVAAQQSDGAAVNALVLVSFPMVGGKKRESREQILLDLPDNVDVLFVVGSKDSMCDMDHLNRVIGKMKARSWVVEVQRADHGMSLRPNDGVQPIRMKTGSIAAQWLAERDASKRYCLLSWDEASKAVVSDGWQHRSMATKKDSSSDHRPAKQRKK